MAAKTVNFNTLCNLSDSHLETVAKWFSCNGEIWGVGPTLVFASAAALFLYNELKATVFAGGHGQVYMLEKTLISTMVLGMLALMIHLWVCSMRFFQYYLDTLIRESPNMLLEITTASLLGGKAELVALGPLTRFLRQQQPQIHITVCWFLSLCYADYIRKNYCQRFNLPYLEQWSSESAPSKGSSVVVCATCSGTSSANGATSGMLDLCEATGLSQSAKELHMRLADKASEATAQAIEKLRNDIKLYEWAKCGENAVSVVPTVLWAAGTGALAQRLLSALFRRSMFRRVPLWELILQHLLFIWMVIYCLHFWIMVVQVIKTVVGYCFDDGVMVMTEDEVESRKVVQQWMIWVCGTAPLAMYIKTRPRPEMPPLMIWITTSPWQRREMGPYGYYLNRPLTSSLHSSTNVSRRQQTLTLRRAFSDSRVIIKEPPKKKRYSKSV